MKGGVLRGLLAVFFALWLSVFAQLGPYVERVYDVRDLLKRPGVVVLSPGFLTIVDVDEQVEQVASARSDLFEVKVYGNSLYIRPTKRAGTTDLVVTAGGRVFMLRLWIDENSFTTYRYRIRFPMTDKTGIADPAVSGESRPMVPVSPGVQGSRGKGESSSPAAESSLQVEFTVTRAGEGVLVEYRAVNAGRNPFVLDPARVRVRGGGSDLPYRLLWREGTAVAGRVLPGETERGAFLVDRAAVPLEFSWVAVEVGTGRAVEIGRKWAELEK